jgi:hypothetical protein
VCIVLDQRVWSHHLFSRGERVFEVEGVWDVVVVGGVGGGHASEFMSNSDLAKLFVRDCLTKIGHVSFFEACIEGVGGVSIWERGRKEFLSC